MKPTILCAGPVFGGEATRPYRFVVLRWLDHKFSCHTQFLDDIGGFSDGEYFTLGPKVDAFENAVRWWHARIKEELAVRPTCLLHDFVPNQ